MAVISLKKIIQELTGGRLTPSTNLTDMGAMTLGSVSATDLTLSTPLAIAQGGTGATTASTGLANLGGAALAYLYNHISGFVWSNSILTPLTQIYIASGVCMDSTNTAMLVGSGMTKKLDAVWAAGDGSGGLDTGARAAGTEYYIHAILKTVDASVDYLFSLSRTNPTLPAGYAKFRNIGWFKTDGSSNIVQFICTEEAGGGITYQWLVPIMDVLLSNTLTTTARLDALSVMSGVKVWPLSVIRAADATSSHYELITDPDTTDTAPTTSLFNMVAASTDNNSILCPCMTNTSRQIRARSTLATVDTYAVLTSGFKWSRR